MLDTRRHKHIFDPKKFNLPVHIIGCGGMGSRVAEGLVRMGVGLSGQSPIILHDHDHFEMHNLTNQWVSLDGISLPKVTVVKSQMNKIVSDAQVRFYQHRIDENNVGNIELSGVVFLCLDSMLDRRSIVDGALEKNRQVSCVIETRMDAGVGISHCFDPCNEKQLECWGMYWHSDEEAENLVGCGSPQSIISAIYSTTGMALKMFEKFAESRSTNGMKNRVYYDFVNHYTNSEYWPTS